MNFGKSRNYCSIMLRLLECSVRQILTKFDRVSGVGSELGAFSPWCQWKILTAEAGFLAAAGARLVFGSKALNVSRTPPVPLSAIRFDCRLVSCILFLLVLI